MRYGVFQLYSELINVWSCHPSVPLKLLEQWFPLRIRKVLLPQPLYNNSALMVLNGPLLSSVNALLALNWWYILFSVKTFLETHTCPRPWRDWSVNYRDDRISSIKMSARVNQPSYPLGGTTHQSFIQGFFPFHTYELIWIIYSASQKKGNLIKKKF